MLIARVQGRRREKKWRRRGRGRGSATKLPGGSLAVEKRRPGGAHVRGDSATCQYSSSVDQDVDTDTWLAKRKAGILQQPLLSTNVDMYRPGQPRPPPTTTPQTSTSASKTAHQDLLQRCSQRSNSPTVAELMRRLKEEGLMDRPKYNTFHSEDPRLDADQSVGSWLRSPVPDNAQEMQPEISQKLKSPQGGNRFSSSSFIEPNDATSRSIQNAQYLVRLAQSSRQRQEKIHDMKSMGLDINTMSESGHVTIASTAATSASPASEKQQISSSDAELKRTESISSGDLAEMEMVAPGGGRSGRSCHKMSTSVSKNLVSERKRRKKLNDGLYSLRALVPRISKMDKASIVGDAIDYVKELKQEIEDIELEISDLERKAIASHVTVNESSAGSMLSDSKERASDGKEVKEAGVTVVTEPNDGNIVTDTAVMETKNTKPLGDNSQGQPPVLETRILNMEVDKLDEQMYHLKIYCRKGPGVLVQLTQALESLDLDVHNAYHTSLQESILNTFIVEMKNLDMKEAEDVRKTLLDVAAQHGLVQA